MRHLSFGKGLNYFWSRATHQAMEIKADFRLGELEFQVSRYQWDKGRKLDRIYHFEELLFFVGTRGKEACDTLGGGSHPQDLESEGTKKGYDPQIQRIG